MVRLIPIRGVARGSQANDQDVLCALHRAHGASMGRSVRRTSGTKGDAMTLQEFLCRKSDETPDGDGLEMTPFARIRIAHEYEDGVMVSGLAVETLPKGLRRRCMEAVMRYRGETGQEPSWLFIDSTEEQIIVR